MNSKARLVEMVGKEQAEKWIQMVKAGLAKETAPVTPAVEIKPV